MIVTEDDVVKDCPMPEGGVKSIEFVAQKTEMPREDFRGYWREVHGPLAAKISVIQRYVQSHTCADLYENGGSPVYDGVAITLFDRTKDMRGSATLPAYAATRDGGTHFLWPEKLPLIITRAHIIVPC